MKGKDLEGNEVVRGWAEASIDALNQELEEAIRKQKEAQLDTNYRDYRYLQHEDSELQNILDEVNRS